MASIHTLVDDVYRLLEEKGGGAVDPSTFLGERVATAVAEKISDDQTPRLRPSNIGKECIRATWYEIHEPEHVTPFDGQTLMKFMTGNVLEEVLLFLAEQAGHAVSHQQHRVELHGLQGSIDAIIDGCLVDVKSASTYAFDQYVNKGISPDNDPFGYIHQANFYLHAMEDLPELVEKDRAYLFVIDKEKARLGLAVVHKVDIDWENLINEKRIILESDTPPPRAYQAVPIGKSGNEGPPRACNSWCRSVDRCWPGTRKFLYSDGIVRLTKVKRTPNVSEVYR